MLRDFEQLLVGKLKSPLLRIIPSCWAGIISSVKSPHSGRTPLKKPFQDPLNRKRVLRLEFEISWMLHKGLAASDPPKFLHL